MRRLLMGFICGVVAGYAVWLLVIRRFEEQPMQTFTPRPAPPQPVVEPEPVAEPEPIAVVEPITVAEPAPEPVAEIVPLPVREPEPAPVEPEPPVRDSERRLQELAALRAELLVKVDRRALYTMAHDRGLPHHALFSMSPEQLWDAVLGAEELPPSDVLPSADTEQRVRGLVTEAFARHERFAAEDAAAAALDAS